MLRLGTDSTRRGSRHRMHAPHGGCCPLLEPSRNAARPDGLTRIAIACMLYIQLM